MTDPNVISDFERTWKARADQAKDNELAQLRDTANKWASTLSILVGVSTVAGLIQTRDTMSKLSSASQIIFALVFVLALGISIYAVYLGAIASQGTPLLEWTDTDSFRKWYENEVKSTVHQLKLSRICAVIPAVLVVIMVFILWYGPTQQTPEAGTNIVAIQKTGKAICGTLEQKDGNLVVSTGGAFSVSFTEITSFSVVSSCPKALIWGRAT